MVICASDWLPCVSYPVGSQHNKNWQLWLKPIEYFLEGVFLPHQAFEWRCSPSWHLDERCQPCEPSAEPPSRCFLSFSLGNCEIRNDHRFKMLTFGVICYAAIWLANTEGIMLHLDLSLYLCSRVFIEKHHIWHCVYGIFQTRVLE